MFKNKNKKEETETTTETTTSGVTMSPALAEIIERKKSGKSKTAKKTKSKSDDLKDTSDIPDELILIKRKPKLAPTISVIIDKELRDKAGEILRKDKRTMTEFIHKHLTDLVNGTNQ